MTRIAAERPPIRMLGVSRWGDEVRISREMFFCGMGGFFVRSPGLSSLTARPPERGRVGVPNEMLNERCIHRQWRKHLPEKMEVVIQTAGPAGSHPTMPGRGAEAPSGRPWTPLVSLAPHRPGSTSEHP